METKKQPNPGSKEAIKNGCLCAVLDNRHGLGAFDALDGQFWISANCPLHGNVASQQIKEVKDNGS